MMKRIIIYILVVALLISACNMPASTSAESAEAVQTSAAQTVEAAINNPAPLASPTSANSGNIQATSTNSSGEPSARFEDVTNCRTGPGVNYQRLTQIQPNEPVKIIGFYPPNYWVVSTNAGTCWVAGQFVTPAGNISAVPTVTAPPTPQGGAPQNVSIRNYNNSCDYVTNQSNIYIEWADKDGETGYRVFRNNELVVELPADSGTFVESITLLSGQSVSYYITAFNAAGEASSTSIAMYC